MGRSGGENDLTDQKEEKNNFPQQIGGKKKKVENRFPAPLVEITTAREEEERVYQLATVAVAGEKS